MSKNCERYTTTGRRRRFVGQTFWMVDDRALCPYVALDVQDREAQGRMFCILFH